MVYYALRSFLLFLSGYYVFLKIAKQANLIRPKYELLWVLGIALATSAALACLKQAYLAVYILCIQITSFVTFKFLYKMKWSTAYTVTTIAYGIVHGMLFVSSFLVTAVWKVSSNQPPAAGWSAFAVKLIPVVLNMLFLFLLLRVRRLRSGFPFLRELRIFDVSVVISNLIQMLITVMSMTNAFYIMDVIISFLMCIFLFVSYLLWKNRIRAKYIRALKQQETAATQETIREQAEQIRTLSEENSRLAAIIHRDNKLIPAMELSVRTYLQSDGQDHVLGAQLAEQLTALVADRKGILAQYEQDSETIQHTGCAAIDIVLDYMHQKARQENVCFRTDCLGYQAALTRQKIEETDIKTILADLIENAIIACRNTTRKQVFVYIGAIRNRLTVRVFDSGIPFEIDTLRKVGIEKTTTHADAEGSGIGMQTLFFVKSKYASSVMIQEYEPEQSLFTKDIAVIFNRFNHFIIRSYRSGQIRSECRRNDMIVETAEKTRGKVACTAIPA